MPLPLTQGSESISDQFRFQRLVEPHLARLLGFAARRLRNSADAEDVVQEACTRAWLAFGDLRDERQILGWLYRILRSAIGDFVEKRDRRERLAPTLGLEFAGDHLLASEDPAPLERLIASMSIEAIYELMRTLPEEFALAMELHDLEGLRYREIAELTGAPIGTVMSRLSRGRRALAALIATDVGLRDLVTPEQDRVPRRVLKREA